ncbi:hypothetical protein GDO81_000549 [Engystomops pustulosus]|uniref:Uncharacterized protein n=1 Tax=Engystomops pustulosus TaxID=76066 RepID=A0AAV7D6K6_ENGPU|nr:hypothetical protein GDO81_000549 [Engystomops pustulosus]
MAMYFYRQMICFYLETARQTKRAMLVETDFHLFNKLAKVIDILDELPQKRRESAECPQIHSEYMCSVWKGFSQNLSSRTIIYNASLYSRSVMANL